MLVQAAILPVFLAVSLGGIGLAASKRNSPCTAANTLLLALIGLFILGPAIIVLYMALRIDNIRTNKMELLGPDDVLIYGAAEIPPETGMIVRARV